MPRSEVVKALIEVPVIKGKDRIGVERREITLRVLARAEGYAMVRKPGQTPFVLEERRLIKI